MKIKKNGKVNELMNSEAVDSGFKQISANRVEREPRG